MFYLLAETTVCEFSKDLYDSRSDYHMNESTAGADASVEVPCYIT